MPPRGGLGHREIPSHVPDPRARTEAQVSIDLAPSCVGEASPFRIQVDIQAFAGDRLLQGASDPSGHVTPPGTPAKSSRGLLPVSIRESGHPAARPEIYRGRRGRSSASIASRAIVGAGTA